MKNRIFRYILSATSLFALMVMAGSTAFAAPVRLTQVVQVVNAKPGKASTGGFTQLRLAGDDPAVNSANDDPSAPAQDDRVITQTTTEIVDDDTCDCIPIKETGFPKWPLLGLAAIPIAIVLLNRDKDTPTPTPTPTGTPTTPTPTPTNTPTPTPTATPTPTNTPTPSPTPEPVPEPMTLLLFGSGLAGIGVAARKRLRRRTEDEIVAEEEV